MPFVVCQLSTLAVDGENDPCDRNDRIPPMQVDQHPERRPCHAAPRPWLKNAYKQRLIIDK